jgi:hypothetical protein
MVQNIIKIIIELGAFFLNIKNKYLNFINHLRQKKQTRSEDRIKKEVMKGKIDDLNKRLMD